ncbi:MAG: hypothetical protein L6311_16565 [Cellulomonas sp.]|nr:hypothetical protein [Cellulomonas sp.]
MSTTDGTATDLVPPLVRTWTYVAGTALAAAVAPTIAAGWTTAAAVLGILSAAALALATAYRPTRQ